MKLLVVVFFCCVYSAVHLEAPLCSTTLVVCVCTLSTVLTTQLFTYKHHCLFNHPGGKVKSGFTTGPHRFPPTLPTVGLLKSVLSISLIQMVVKYGQNFTRVVFEIVALAY